MRLMDHRLREKTWTALTGEWAEFNGFGFDAEARQNFEAAFAELETVNRDGSSSYVSRKKTSQPFNHWNIQVTNVESGDDFERVTYPAIQLESNHD